MLYSMFWFILGTLKLNSCSINYQLIKRKIKNERSGAIDRWFLEMKIQITGARKCIIKSTH